MTAAYLAAFHEASRQLSPQSAASDMNMHLGIRRAKANMVSQIILWLLQSLTLTLLCQMSSIVGTSLLPLWVHKSQEPVKKKSTEHNPSPFTAEAGNQSAVTDWQLTRNRGGQVDFLMNCFCIGKAACPNKRKPAVMATKSCVCSHMWNLMCM